MKYLLIIIAFLSPMLALTQGHSFVRQYGKQLSLSGPTWDINVLDDNFVLFANGENILMYENGSFSAVPFPTELRCVHIARQTERIYAGGVN
ncbi:MAG: hypothetical protein IJ150_07665 [Bacteroidales bacterium]|nr:hypothetical protein [Bacteroidales bacterium]